MKIFPLYHMYLIRKVLYLDGFQIISGHNHDLMIEKSLVFLLKSSRFILLLGEDNFLQPWQEGQIGLEQFSIVVLMILITLRYIIYLLQHNG